MKSTALKNVRDWATDVTVDLGREFLKAAAVPVTYPIYKIVLGNMDRLGTAPDDRRAFRNKMKYDILPDRHASEAGMVGQTVGVSLWAGAFALGVMAVGNHNAAPKPGERVVDQASQCPEGVRSWKAPNGENKLIITKGCNLGE